MTSKKFKLFDIIVLLLIIVIAIIVYIVSNNITKNKIELVKQEKYNIYAKNINNEIEIFIKNKTELTLSIALALSKNTNIIEALKTNKTNLLKLKEFSKELKNTTKLKDTWFQIIDNKGITFYRSWINKKGDAIIKSRLDVVKMIEKPQFMTTISTGKFDMTFKSMVPIYDDDKFIGMFEIISHFNSISKELLDSNINSVILVDKRYKKQLTKNLTKNFIDDYYVANTNAKKEFINIIKKNTAEYYFNNTDEYILDTDNNQFIVTFDIPDIKGDNMGKIITFKNFNLLNIEDIDNLKINMMFYVTLIILIITTFGYFLVTRKNAKELDNKVKERTKELNNEKNYIQTLLDTNSSIILVTRNSNIISANRRFLEFFDYDSMDKFKENHKCICEFFLTLDNEEFSKDYMVNDILWSEYLAKNHKTEHSVKLRYKDKNYHFIVFGLYLTDKREILLTFQNVTDLKHKDKLLFEQSKMASMGEMIGNIAHQWRQPLSVISTASTGMIMQKEFGVLTDELLIKSCNAINDNAQYLSKTIDDFKNFIKGDRIKKVFNLKSELDSFLHLVEGSIKSHNINVILDIKEDININGYENELTQCFINIFNNAKDALTENIKDKRLVFISALTKDNNVIITIKDNAGGIPADVLPKIFEPYFTTKHQSQGTGLGLHMTYNLILDGMGGTINAINVNYEYKSDKHTGAEFTITLPLN